MTDEKCLTVRELIAELGKYHPDAPVMVYDGGQFDAIIAVEQDWPDLPDDEAPVELHI